MKKIGILTLGCRVNQYESDAVREALENRGYRVVGAEKDCVLYIINTCTVTAESDAKCRKAIRRVARLRDEAHSALVVMGCFSQGDPDSEVLSLADYVIGTRDKMSVVEKLDDIIAKKEHGGVVSLAGAPFEKMNITRCAHAKAYVKIEDGCNNFCTYCFVPYVRGRVRSRDESDILSEIKSLSENSYREIILTGIETASFGEDRGESDALCALVEKIEKETDITRVRFGSMYPTFFTKERAERLAKSKIVMPHFHLSVQSGADAVLEKMGRKYNEKELFEAVENIREAFPDATLSCDIICGFPGESEEDFKKSLYFIEKAEILHAHIFPYSKRRLTRAADFDSQVKEEIKKERTSVMQSVAGGVSLAVRGKYIGKRVRVLVEKIVSSRAFGYTENFIYTSFPMECKVGDIVEIELKKEYVQDIQI